MMIKKRRSAEGMLVENDFSYFLFFNDFLNYFQHMTTVFQEKTIKYLGQSANPAAAEVLASLVGNPDDRIRSLAFDKLYLKKVPELYLFLFKNFLNDKDYWLSKSCLSKERLTRLVETAFQSTDSGIHRAAVETITQYRLYGTLTVVVSYLEGADTGRSHEARATILQLANLFYDEILGAPESERRNFDRLREWFVQQLNGPIKRYAVTGFDELLQSLLILTKKDYDTMKTVMLDHRSAACRKIADLLQNGKHGSYIRLLLSYVNDVSSPPVIDEILITRSDNIFVRKLLETVGTNPSIDFRESLKRFKRFAWFVPYNTQLQEMLEGLEPCAVQLLQACSMPKGAKLQLYKFFFENPSFEARRAAAASIRYLVGDEVNNMLLHFVNDPDAPTAAAIFRILKSRGVKETDSFFENLVNRPEPEIRKAIYDMAPDLHVESLASRISQMTQETAKRMGRYVRLVDPNTAKMIDDDIFSPIPIRRLSACLVAAVTGYANNFANRLIEIAETDDDPSVRCAALSALPNILTKDAVETIKLLMNDQSMLIRDTATTTLRIWMETYQAAKK
jgi:hypothetical protein